MSAITYINRWNTGSLRRYHIIGGAVIVCKSPGKGGAKATPAILPAWCNHIDKSIPRSEAAALLRYYRALTPCEVAA